MLRTCQTRCAIVVLYSPQSNVLCIDGCALRRTQGSKRAIDFLIHGTICGKSVGLFPHVGFGIDMFRPQCFGRVNVNSCYRQERPTASHGL